MPEVLGWCILIKIGECVAIINCEPLFAKLLIKAKNSICLVGDSADSGSSSIKIHFLKWLLNSDKNASQCDLLFSDIH